MNKAQKDVIEKMGATPRMNTKTHGIYYDFCKYCA
jgi:hypothetical protein